MTQDSHPRDTTEDPGPDRASGQVRSDAPIKTDPPGSGDRDDAAVQQGEEKLDYVESGH